MAAKDERPDVKQIFTDFLRQMADEKTEFVELPGEDGGKGELGIRTKAEALARYVWKCALGWKELKDNGEEVIHEPDKGAINLLFDRLEGKIVAIPMAGKKGPTIADKVNAAATRALNKIADE